MIYRPRSHRTGFTLTEMAIVLGVVGILVAGLWNLIAGANQQARDESAASQQTQLITAVKAYLLTLQGQQFMVANAGCGGTPCGTTAANTNFSLPLPTSCSPSTFGAPYAGDVNLPQFCAVLPPGFTSATINSYGQKFIIQIQRDGTIAGSPPNSYSFMVLTTAGTPVPDTSGSRIAALIGGDGGFLYTNSVCGTPVATTACGSYGGWTVSTTGAPPAGFGFAAASSASGSVASRTYVTPQLNALSDWLARVPMPGDSTFTLNTMTTPEYLGGNNLDMGGFPVTGGGGKAFNLEGGSLNYLNDTSAGGSASITAINAQGGKINMEGGTIDLGPGQIINSGATGGNDAIILNGTDNTGNAVIQASMPCTIASYDPVKGWVDGSTPSQPCKFAISSNSITSSGLIEANGFYAGTFIYQASDASLKKNIRPLMDPLSRLERINPVEFTYKLNDKESMGVLAQDVEKVYPQLVAMGDHGKKYVSYEGLIAPLIGAVQELKKENDDLRQRLKDDEARQSELEKQLKQTKPN